MSQMNRRDFTGGLLASLLVPFLGNKEKPTKRKIHYADFSTSKESLPHPEIKSGDLYFSKEALEDMRNWHIDIIDDITRKEIFNSIGISRKFKGEI